MPVIKKELCLKARVRTSSLWAAKGSGLFQPLSDDPNADLTNPAHTMILTQCAACAKPLAYDAPRRVAASVR